MTESTPNPPRWEWAMTADESPEPVDVFSGPAAYDELAAPPVAAGREIPMGEFTEREWAIFRQGQRWGWESRRSEVDAAWNAYNGADYDADRYYRAAYDHDNHDCTIHANKGPYQGARARLLQWDYWPDEEEMLPLDTNRGDA
ncbi:hypothetical protein [Curtobacterium sp. VKM Ac-2887]|uniref:hypothetical protein n=1 Tax=Curtobacterium sp. VKM Ac-2887 TaxID=2783819 RepID=UPI00188B1D77|nr:hypothetical protein [Curtobacterium sp. VKM Ac-2887]MBF4588394.1 hypothetical protein [Curtobacterium sp. VKM Ac-2887]